MADQPMVKTDVPGVYRRGDRYVYTYRKRGKQRWGSARTKAEARRLKRNAETDVERGEHRDLSRATFGEYAREWIEHYAGRTSSGFREPTRRWYRQMLEDRLIPYFDHERGLRLAEIEPRDIKALIAWLAQQPNPHEPSRTLGRSTIGYHVAVLRALFADAVEEGVLRSSPTTGVRVAVPTTSDDEQAKAMTRAELSRVLDEIDPKWTLFFEFLAHTGLRISEAIELRWRDLDLSLVPVLRVRRQLRDGEAVGPKTAAGRRTIPLAPGMADRLRARQGAPDELVFPTVTGRQINRSNLWRKVLKPAAERAGVPWISFHTFRHTCASLLFAADKNVKQVQAWLGHADPGFTVRTYIHLLDEGVGDAGFLDDVVGNRSTLAPEEDGRGSSAL
jgi:integrase